MHPIDVWRRRARASARRWPLFDDTDRAAEWRIGGTQHLARARRAADRLYALVHQGGADTHKQPGTEVWVYDSPRAQRVQRIAMRNPLVSFVSQRGALAGRRTRPHGTTGCWSVRSRTRASTSIAGDAGRASGADRRRRDAADGHGLRRDDGAVQREISEVGLATRCSSRR